MIMNADDDLNNMSNENDAVTVELDFPADIADAIEASAAELGISTDEWIMNALKKTMREKKCKSIYGNIQMKMNELN